MKTKLEFAFCVFFGVAIFYCMIGMICSGRYVASAVKSMFRYKEHDYAAMVDQIFDGIPIEEDDAVLSSMYNRLMSDRTQRFKRDFESSKEHDRLDEETRMRMIERRKQVLANRRKKDQAYHDIISAAVRVTLNNGWAAWVCRTWCGSVRDAGSGYYIRSRFD